MKIKPMLGSFALDGIEYIESSESRALVEHRVPGLAGNYFQDMGSVPNAIVIMGSKHGDEARDNFLSGIRGIFNKGEPTTFVADINTATDITDVIIEDLQVTEVGASPDSFRYLLKIRKYVKPPEPPATDLLDTSILDDALGVFDALNTLDALSSISNLGDPTPPVRQALDAVKAATGGLDGVVSDLNALFAKDVPASAAPAPPAAPGVEGAAPPSPAPAGPALVPEAGETAPSAPGAAPQALQIDPTDPRIDPALGNALQQMLAAPETSAAATTLVQGVQGGALAGIFGEDADNAQSLAAAYGTQPSQLIPAGQDAALILDPASPLKTPPTILLKSGIGLNPTPSRLAAALEEVNKTFNLWQQHELAPCDSTAAAIPVPNLVPSTFCQVPATPPGPAPVVEPEEIDPSAPDLQIDPGDPRIDVGAKFALQRMIKNPDTAVDAARLIRGINGGTLAGIYGDDLGAAVKVAHAHGTERWLLVPKGEDAALVLDADAPLDAPPTVIFRGDTPDIRSDHPRIDAALQKASQTFAPFQQGKLGPCESSPSAIPVSNLVPPSFCYLPEIGFLGGGFLPSVFSSKRNFPKPSALPFLREVAQRAAADPAIQVLVIGHTDATGSDAMDAMFSLARAQAVAALLTGDEAFLRACFSTPDPLTAWDWEEAQFMMSALALDDDLFYAGVIDGDPGPLSANAVARFQTFHDLEVTEELDGPTLDCLVHEYALLVGPVRPAAAQVIVHGGGSWHPPRSLGEDSQPLPSDEVPNEVHPGPHRVEIFLAPGGLDPPLSSCPATNHAACAAYEAWCKKTRDPISITRNFLMPIRLVDANRGRIAKQAVELFEHTEEADEKVAALTTNSAGLIFLQAPPGIYSLRTTIGGETFAAPFRAHADQVGGMTIHLPVEVIPDDRLAE